MESGVVAKKSTFALIILKNRSIPQTPRIVNILKTGLNRQTCFVSQSQDWDSLERASLLELSAHHLLFLWVISQTDMVESGFLLAPCFQKLSLAISCSQHKASICFTSECS
jgi:hypothetical protein